MLKPDKLTRLVHKVEDQHIKMSKRGHRVKGSVLDATPQQLKIIQKLANGKKYYQTKLF